MVAFYLLTIGVLKAQGPKRRAYLNWACQRSKRLHYSLKTNRWRHLPITRLQHFQTSFKVKNWWWFSNRRHSRVINYFHMLKRIVVRRLWLFIYAYIVIIHHYLCMCNLLCWSCLINNMPWRLCYKEDTHPAEHEMWRFHQVKRKTKQNKKNHSQREAEQKWA